MWSHAVSHKAEAAIWVSHMLGQPLLYRVMLPPSLTRGIPVSQQASHGTPWTLMVD